jgi:hypothetical protein
MASFYWESGTEVGGTSKLRKRWTGLQMPLCKLCKQDRELQESHFLPAAVYAQLRDPAQQNPNPVLITSQISLSTSKQITDRVLCDECEQRFSRLGETWVLANMARPEGFPIQEALAATAPIAANESFAYYSSAAISTIKMDALVYFALSIFWRASAHRWRNVSGFMEGIDLGPFEEPIRCFLLGDRFPADTVILVSCWPTRDVVPAAYTPRRGRAPGYHCFNFLIPGLEFKLLVGRQIPEILRAMCSHASADKLIFCAMLVVSDTTEAFTKLATTSRVSKGLQGITK